jgi:tRNA pseudouridine synthase 10
MGDLDRIIEKIDTGVVTKYEFDSFLLGATLPTKMYEREDQIRARFKVRGRESIKKQLVKELGAKFMRSTKKRLEHLIPDIRINVVIDSKNDICVNARTSPLILTGRYVKRQRGLPQKKVKCHK